TLPPCDSILSFFFQAEDGIRDFHVTGVQTCALPISFIALGAATQNIAVGELAPVHVVMVCGIADRNIGTRCGVVVTVQRHFKLRSEERRVGKEWRWRW